MATSLSKNTHDGLRGFELRLQRRHKREELREELQFHLSEEVDERQAGGLSADQATRAARRDLGNVGVGLTCTAKVGLLPASLRSPAASFGSAGESVLPRAVAL